MWMDFVVCDTQIQHLYIIHINLRLQNFTVVFRALGYSTDVLSILTLILGFRRVMSQKSADLSIFVLRIDCLYLLQLTGYQFYIDIREQRFVS
jgi:hypothetical protein